MLTFIKRAVSSARSYVDECRAFKQALDDLKQGAGELGWVPSVDVEEHWLDEEETPES